MAFLLKKVILIYKASIKNMEFSNTFKENEEKN